MEKIAKTMSWQLALIIFVKTVFASSKKYENRIL